MRRSGLKMKLTHQRMTGRYDSTPESVLDWLEEQLECRGIDAVVYTRYILSLLQDYDDHNDEDVAKDINGFCCERVVKRQSNLKENIKAVTSNKWKHRRYRTICPDIGQDCWPHYQCCALNSDHQRKLAVVQCLKSASEEELGIESFVDELCAKLKNIKLLSETVSDMTAESDSEITNNNNVVKVSPKEQAMKYYAAFPALDNNSNEDTTLVPKICTDVSLREVFITTSSERNKWNGQKIIEFINGNNSCDELTNDPINCVIGDNKTSECLKMEEKENKAEVVHSIDSKGDEENFYYCEDIESSVMDVPLVDNQCPNICYSLDGIQEENDRFERLVNKFNRNIASIWSTPQTDSVLAKNDNIWSFDSSFSSNQSSAAQSPKTCAIDLWSSLSIKELNESLSEQRAQPLNGWTNTVFQSVNAFTDDGFIDGNHDLFDEDINWCISGADIVSRKANKISLENHQKNSPFIEFNSNEKTCQKQSELTKLLSLTSILDSPQQSDNCLSPLLEENLLTSSKTHFQPIKEDCFEKDESDVESVSDINNKEVNKLVICSDKCPNNSEPKPQKTYDSLKLRPISTSFGELASLMGPFNDFEWNSNEYPTQLITKDHNYCQMRDKSTNTESECQLDLKPRLSSIVEMSGEGEPEYQDLYQMINDVVRNGISEDDSTTIGSSSSSSSSVNRVGLTNTDHKSISNNLSFNCCSDINDSQSVNQLLVNSKVDIPQNVIDLKRISPDYSVDEAFGEELYKNSDLLENCGPYEEVYSEDSFIVEHKLDSIYCPSVCDNSMTLSLPEDTRRMSFDWQYKRRHNQNVGQTGQSQSRVQKPCTFFIEGYCKRSDCKYSHEISAITCKYWEEGFCFKAQLCPFLHGYVGCALDYDDTNRIQTNVSSDDSKSYAIESESDFPSLSTKSVDSEDITTTMEADPTGDCLEQHFFGFHTKSVKREGIVGTVGSSKAKLPIAVFIKKKLRKRKDRNLQ